jgi:hypothetical protein
MRRTRNGGISIGDATPSVAVARPLGVSLTPQVSLTCQESRMETVFFISAIVGAYGFVEGKPLAKWAGIGGAVFSAWNWWKARQQLDQLSDANFRLELQQAQAGPQASTPGMINGVGPMGSGNPFSKPYPTNEPAKVLQYPTGNGGTGVGGLE